MDACRICRGEAEEDEPLYHPCKCSGSIRFVHETCLIEWINHSGNGNKCDLCHTPYIFKKVYSQRMPAKMPAKAYMYAAAMQLKQFVGALNLLSRCIVMLVLTVFAVKYSVESANYFGDDHAFWPQGAAQAAQAAKTAAPRVPRFLTIAKRMPWQVQELAYSLEVGVVLTAGVLAAALLFYTVCELTFSEPVLIHDLDHIINGEPGHLDFADDAYPGQHDAAHTEQWDRAQAQGQRAQDQARARVAPAAVPAAAALAEPAAAPPAEPAAAAAGGDEEAYPIGPPTATEIPAPNNPPAVESATIVPLMYEGPLVFMYKHAHDGVEGVRTAIPGLTLHINTEPGAPQLPMATEIHPAAARSSALAPVRVPPPPGGRLDLPGADGFYRRWFAQHGLEVLDPPGGMPFNAQATPNYTTRWAEAPFLVNNHPIVDFDRVLGDDASPEVLAAIRNIIDRQEEFAELRNEPPRDVDIDVDVDGDDGDDADDDADWNDIDEVDDLFDRNDELADENEWNFLAVVDQLVGGPLVPAFVGFAWFLVAVVSMILVFYYLPSLTGRSVLAVAGIASRAALASLRDALPVAIPEFSAAIDPTQLVMRLATMYIGYGFLLSVTHSVYNLFYFRLLGDEQGRAVLMFLKQVHAVIKVFHAMVIELVVFPMFCGINVHVAVLPLLPWHGVAGTLAMVRSHIYTVLFAYWASGLIYMFLLAGFLSSCRRFLRKGVLYFVEDPSDPRSEPVKKILSNTFTNHMRKMAISALIYVGLIVGGIGSATALLRLAVPELWPLELAVGPRWADAEKWPLVVLLYAATMRGLFSKTVWIERLDQFWKYVFEKGAAACDLDSFLFGVPKSPDQVSPNKGTFVRAPTSDTFKSRKNLELFPVVDINDKRPDGKRRGARELKKYTVVWRPRFFWLRVAALFVYMWAYASLALIIGLGGSYGVGLAANHLLWASPLQNSLLVLLTGLMLLANFVYIVGDAGGVRGLPLALFNVFATGLCFNYGDFNQLLAPPFVSIGAPSDNVITLTFLIGFALIAALGPQHKTLFRVALVGGINALSKLVPQPLLTALGYIVRPLVSAAAVGIAIMTLGADGAFSSWTSKARDAFYLEATVLQNLDSQQPQNAQDAVRVAQEI